MNTGRNRRDKEERHEPSVGTNDADPEGQHADQLRKIYFPIAESWKLIREFCDATGTPVECFKVHERAQDIYERSDKTQFATEIVSATVNLVDRLMRENGGTAKEWRK